MTYFPLPQGEGLVRLAMEMSPSTFSADRRLLDGPFRTPAPLVGAMRPANRAPAATGPTAATCFMLAPEANGTTKVTCTTPKLGAAENKS